METMPLATPKTLFAAAASLAFALTGAACAGDADPNKASTDAPTAQTTAQTDRGGAADTSSARLATAEFDVDGMTCGGCAIATEMAVKKLDGVKSADAEYDEATDEGRCSVTYDPSVVSTDQIGGAIEEAGFTPNLVHSPSGS